MQMASQAPGSPVHLTTHVPAPPPPQTHPRSLGLPPPPFGMPRLPLQQQPFPGNTLGGHPNPQQQHQQQQQYTMPQPAPGMMRPPPRTLGQQLALNTPLTAPGGGPPLGQPPQPPQQQWSQQQQQQPSAAWGGPAVIASGSALGLPPGSGFARGAQAPILGAAIPPTAAAAAATATPEVQGEVERLRREVAAAQQGREEMRYVCQGQ